MAANDVTNPLLWLFAWISIASGFFAELNYCAVYEGHPYPSGVCHQLHRTAVSTAGRLTLFCPFDVVVNEKRSQYSSGAQRFNCKQLSQLKSSTASKKKRLLLRFQSVVQEEKHEYSHCLIYVPFPDIIMCSIHAHQFFGLTIWPLLDPTGALRS